MRIRSYRVRTLIGALALAATGIASATDISGAGATFPYPVYSKWAEAYKAQTGVGLNYQSIGSGGGIKQIKAATVTFGASDKPLEAKDLNDSGLVQWPMVIGGEIKVRRSALLRTTRKLMSGEVYVPASVWAGP